MYKMSKEKRTFIRRCNKRAGIGGNADGGESSEGWDAWRPHVQASCERDGGIQRRTCRPVGALQAVRRGVPR
eukprot:CAMPEP_0113663010 /NCGR_PEP_ID=MMETSP0038_2-20120614/899_1 /TAXON_ID=2898 /ORGANISM="Cryptomonas paramecium" /LENGTH=71 /DNA_ID=CAMNT_0000577979 /DNA_START=233 /DNA_END=444 /DNA_ORIENTATION=- /assembly_acc=CAM_ASM_000170